MPDLPLPPVRPDLNMLLDVARATAGESDRFDFKEALDLSLDEHRIRLIRAVGAFCNTDQGGFVLIGVSNDRRLVGLPQEIADAYDQTRVQRIIAQYLSPPPTVQVRHHTAQGQRLVILEIPGFATVPSLVRQSATFGSERLVAGTILYRNTAAESAVLTAESDVQALCNAIVRRRASELVELIQRGSLGRFRLTDGPAFQQLDQLRHRADVEWPPGSPPFIEVGFATSASLQLTPEQLKGLIPGAAVPSRHGFPFHDAIGATVHSPTAWGWYGRIPFAALGEGSDAPNYLWLLSRDGGFLDREHLWEDDTRSVIRGGVGLFHVVGRVVLLLRFVQRYSAVLALASNIGFRVCIRVAGSRGRVLDDERRHFRLPYLTPAAEDTVEASSDVAAAEIMARPTEVALAMLEEMAWQFGRNDWTRQDISAALHAAAEFLGPEYRLQPVAS